MQKLTHAIIATVVVVVVVVLPLLLKRGLDSSFRLSEDSLLTTQLM